MSNLQLPADDGEQGLQSASSDSDGYGWPTARRTGQVVTITNLIGLGLGPLGFGLLSDALSGTLGNESLRYALGLAPLLALWSAYHYLGAGRMLDLGVQRAEEYVGNELPKKT